SPRCRRADRRLYRVHPEEGQKGRKGRTPVGAGAARPVQKPAEKRRDGAHPPEGAGTMKQLNVKKLILLNLPCFLLGLFATNLGEAWRMAQGADASAKMLSFFSTLPVALGSW